MATGRLHPLKAESRDPSPPPSAGPAPACRTDADNYNSFDAGIEPILWPRLSVDAFAPRRHSTSLVDPRAGRLFSTIEASVCQAFSPDFVAHPVRLGRPRMAGWKY